MHALLYCLLPYLGISLLSMLLGSPGHDASGCATGCATGCAGPAEAENDEATVLVEDLGVDEGVLRYHRLEDQM